MLSRVANSIYWMTRYIERVENYARLLGANISLSHDIPQKSSIQWQRLLKVMHDDFDIETSKSNLDIIEFMAFGESNPYSIFNTLAYARENAKSIKETFPTEIWEHINAFYHLYAAAAKQAPADMGQYTQLLNNVKGQCQLFYGIVDSALPRQDAYYFLNLGKFIERADKTSRFLDIGLLNDSKSKNQSLATEDFLIWTTVLKSVSGLNMYKQQFKNIRKLNIFNYLIKDTAFPRSLSFCNYKTNYAIKKLGYDVEIFDENNAENIAKNLSDYLEKSSLIEFNNVELSSYLNEFQLINNKLDRAIFEIYFDLKPKL